MMMSVLQAAGLTLIGATLLAGLVKAFDRWAPRRMVRERHDLALAAFLTVPLIFVAAVLPSPARDAVTVPVYQVQGAADATARADAGTAAAGRPRER